MKTNELYVIYFPYTNDISMEVWKSKTVADKACLKSIENFKSVRTLTMKNPEYLYPKVMNLYDAIETLGDSRYRDGEYDELERNNY